MELSVRHPNFFMIKPIKPEIISCIKLRSRHLLNTLLTIIIWLVRSLMSEYKKEAWETQPVQLMMMIIIFNCRNVEFTNSVSFIFFHPENYHNKILPLSECQEITFPDLPNSSWNIPLSQTHQSLCTEMSAKPPAVGVWDTMYRPSGRSMSLVSTEYRGLNKLLLTSFGMRDKSSKIFTSWVMNSLVCPSERAVDNKVLLVTTCWEKHS